MYEHWTLVHKYASIQFNIQFGCLLSSFPTQIYSYKVCVTMFYLSFRNKILTKLNSNVILKAIENEKRMQRETKEWMKKEAEKLCSIVFCSCWIKANYANGEDCFIRANLLFVIYYILLYSNSVLHFFCWFVCHPIPLHSVSFRFVSFWVGVKFLKLNPMSWRLQQIVFT